MPQVASFHSVNEVEKPVQLRRYHDNSLCAPGRDIPKWERREGTGGYDLCEHCDKYDRQGQ